MTTQITHSPERQRFQTLVDGRHGLCDYRLADGVMHIHHTEVDPALQGRGVAAMLVKAALAHAEQQGWKVNPMCSYVRAYMRRHPETLKLHA